MSFHPRPLKGKAGICKEVPCIKLPAGVLNGSAFFWGALMLAASCGRALSLLYGLTWNISPAPLLVVCALYCVTAIQRVSLRAKRFLFVSAILLCLLELCSLFVQGPLLRPLRKARRKLVFKQRHNKTVTGNCVIPGHCFSVSPAGLSVRPCAQPPASRHQSPC